MLNRGPNIYVPVEPEDNGLTLPAVLSIIVHIAILAFIIFSHRIPNLNDEDPIETSIVTPEELAALQSNVIANRQAKAEQQNAEPIDISSTATQSTQISRSEPITQPQEKSSTRKRFSSLFSSDDPAPEPAVETETSNPFDEEIIYDYEVSDQTTDETTDEGMNASRNKGFNGVNADEDPINPKAVPFGTSNNPYGGTDQGSNGTSIDIEGIKKQIQKDVISRWHPTSRSNQIVTATIAIQTNGTLSISTSPKDSSIPTEFIQSLKKAIKETNNQTPYFTEVSNSGFDTVVLNFKYN